MSTEDDVYAIESATLRSAAMRGFLELVGELQGLARSNGEAFAALVLDLTLPSLSGSVQRAVTEAWRAGVFNAAVLAAVDATAPAHRGAARIGDALDVRVAELLAQAQRLVIGGATPDEAMAPLNAAANSARTTVATEVVQSANEGVRAVTAAAGLATVWVAETNACRHCLAYSGIVADVGEDFPGGLTYGRAPISLAPVTSPPLHPRCRCILEPLNSQEYADALRREADRSVLRGFSLESESMSSRIEAAELLLERGVDAPASVIQFAHRSIEAGAFPTRGPSVG